MQTTLFEQQMLDMVKLKVLKAGITCCKSGSKWYQQNSNKHKISLVIVKIRTKQDSS